MIRQMWRRLALPVVLALTAVIVAAAPAHAAPGSVSGLVLTASGGPAANVAVTVRGSNGPFLHTRTGGDGTYRLADVPAGDYTVLLEPVLGMRQYVPQKRFGSAAQVFAVREGETTVVNETLLAQGNLAGRFVDFDGTPLADASVFAQDLEGESVGFARTDTNGTWRINAAFVGRYRVHFASGQDISQYAYGKVGVAADPDPITVSADATTIVNDTAVARTSLRATVTDALTGARLNSFTVTVGQKFGSTDTGELVLDGLQAGTHNAYVFAEGYFPADVRVTLTVGQQGRLAVALEPESAITVRLVDAATGEPVPDICVSAFTLTDAIVSDGLCGERSDASGNLRVGFLRAGTYQLFAIRSPFGPSPNYGAQWVGANGGTGRQLLAKSFQVGRGQTVTGPVIKLDRPGTITGRVYTPDGQVPTFGRVQVLAGHPFSGTSLGVEVDESGGYTLDLLGPYDWPLLFEAWHQGPQWTGHVGNRHLARTVKVNAGAPTAFDFRFKPATSVTVQVQGLPGLDSVVAVNAITGDFMGGGAGDGTSEATMPLVGPQLVKLLVTPTEGERRWVGGDDFLHAQPFWIPSSGSRTITVRF